MTTWIRFLFYIGTRTDADLRRVLDRAGLVDVCLRGGAPDSTPEIRMRAEDGRVSVLRDLLSEEEIVWSERQEDLYSSRELRSAPLLWLQVKAAEVLLRGPEYGTRYDLEQACPVCGSGAVQTSPLVIRPALLRNKGLIRNTLPLEVIVHRHLAEILVGASVSGLDLRQLVSRGDHTPLPWWQLIPETTMPPLAEETTGLDWSDLEPPCAHCRRDGRFHSPRVPFRLAYRATDVDPDTLPDITQTWEIFGASFLREPFEDSFIGRGLVLVKPKVMDILRAYKVPRVDFVPVRLVG